MKENPTTFGYVVKQSCKRLALVGFAEQLASDDSSYCFFIIIQTKHFTGNKTVQTFKFPYRPHFIKLQRLGRNQQTILATNHHDIPPNLELPQTINIAPLFRQ
jgi:hypothetical protein